MTTAGTDLRDQGYADVLAADASITRDYATLVLEGIERVSIDYATWSAEDVRLYVELNYPDAQPHSPNVLPATIGGLAAAGRIEAVGHVRCTRTSRRAGWMRVWRLTTPPAGATPAAAGVEGAGRGGAANPCQPSPSGRSAGGAS